MSGVGPSSDERGTAASLMEPDDAASPGLVAGPGAGSIRPSKAVVCREEGSSDATLLPAVGCEASARHGEACVRGELGRSVLRNSRASAKPTPSTTTTSAIFLERCTGIINNAKWQIG